MAKETRIRPMEAQDIRSIAALEESCFSKPWSTQALAEELGNEQAVFYVALTEDEEVVGYAGMHNILGEGYITNIAVEEEARHKGIGRKLMETLNAYAEDNAMSFLTLEVRPSNEHAVELYKSMGFVEQGERKDFYTSPRENALIMTKVY